MTAIEEPVISEVTDRVADLGGPLIVPLSEPVEGGAPLAALVEALGGAGPIALSVEAVREGFLCHHGSSRVLDLEDRDLALLVGDLLYAIGLRELALAGDPEPVAILADLIRLVSERTGTGESPAVTALWVGQTTALAAGSDDRHRAALRAIEEGSDGPAEGLMEWARERAREMDWRTSPQRARPAAPKAARWAARVAAWGGAVRPLRPACLQFAARSRPQTPHSSLQCGSSPPETFMLSAVM